MTLPFQAKAVGFAALAGTLALASALAVARVLRADARRYSHQQPRVEKWFETPTPTSAALVAQGRSLFLDSCAHCHGADAHGDEGPDLHDVQVSDRYIANIVTRGIKGEMPAFAKKLRAGDLPALLAYVRSLK